MSNRSQSKAQYKHFATLSKMIDDEDESSKPSDEDKKNISFSKNV